MPSNGVLCRKVHVTDSGGGIRFRLIQKSGFLIGNGGDKRMWESARIRAGQIFILGVFWVVVGGVTDSGRLPARTEQ